MGLKVPYPSMRYSSPLKDVPPKFSIKLSPQKIYDFKITQPF